jgi:hypothetical protein
LDIFERLYYMRALVGVAAGIVAGSLGIGRRIAKNVPRDKRKKVATEGIMPFIFLLLVFMIIVYTALHQSSIVS